jgi:type IV fimbrial biogenesis protein FimT
MLTVRPPSRGFTITEVLVAMAIIAIMLGLGVPSITTYIESAKLNSAAQGYLSGVQMARATAIRQNLRTEFVLTDTPVETANLANVLAESANGQNWVVRAVDPALPPPAFVLIEAKSANESSANAAQSVQILGTGAPAAFTGIVPFNGFGGTADANNYAFALQNPRGGACAPAGPMRCPTILVPAGGLARICDPLLAAATDSRGC